MNQRTQRGFGLASGGIACVLAALLVIPSSLLLTVGVGALVGGLLLAAGGLLFPDRVVAHPVGPPAPPKWWETPTGLAVIGVGVSIPIGLAFLAWAMSVA